MNNAEATAGDQPVTEGMAAPMDEEKTSWKAYLVLFGCMMGVSFNLITLFNGTMTVFINPLSEEGGWSRGQVSLGLSTGMLALLICNPFAGRLADRVSPALLITIGAPLLGLAIASLGLIPLSYPLFLLTCAFVGATGALTYTPIYYIVVTRWFRRRLGLALGITASGHGIGLMAAPVVTQALSAELGWRNTYVAIGIISVVAVLLLRLLLIRDRHDTWTPPARAEAADGAGAPANWRSFIFWRLAFIYFLVGLAINGAFVHLMPMLTDQGMAPEAAAAVVSAMGIGSLLARPTAGFLLDYIDTGLLGALTFLTGATGIFLIVTGWEAAFVPGVFMIGVALGAEADVLAYLVRRIFGLDNFGANMGLITSVFLLGVLIGPALNGGLYDALGSYTLGMSLFVGLLVIAAALHIGLTWRRSRFVA
ncbi:MFS transporter [Henriciella aquimarina]|uniref:MFS transporter n=1 Tax=Henriciella aquimarina TaxID=545261 RepID=UPI0009FC3351|nr:MFS transporter [Henriciella aquimarina]